jgi:hypothetical protein
LRCVKGNAINQSRDVMISVEVYRAPVDWVVCPGKFRRIHNQVKEACISRSIRRRRNKVPSACDKRIGGRDISLRANDIGRAGIAIIWAVVVCTLKYPAHCRAG